MCLTAIITLNLLGISYASFNEDLYLNTTVSTGDMRPHFIDNGRNAFNLAGNDRGEFLDIKMTSDKIAIIGKVNQKFNDNLLIDIGNRGTVPFIFKDIIIVENDNIVQSISISENNKVHLHLKSQQEENETQHHFEYELIFEQWK